MRYLLDTDTSSYAIKGRSPEIERRLAALPLSAVCISVVTRAELLYGLKRLPAESTLHLLVPRFLKIIPALPWDEAAADWYAEIRHRLSRKGEEIGHMDMMIAAHALALGASVVTNNERHFRRIKAPLKIVNWTKR